MRPAWWPVPLEPLPRRVRARLAWRRGVDAVGIWLVARGRWRLALYWWRVVVW